MTPSLVVTPGDPTPPYEQLRCQLVDLIEGGRLVEGERLPPLRQLAGDLGLAVGTVARTYRELEVAGLVRSRRGGGTRVIAGPSSSSQRDRARRLDELAVSFVEGQALGATDEEIGEAVRRSLA